MTILGSRLLRALMVLALLEARTAALMTPALARGGGRRVAACCSQGSAIGACKAARLAQSGMGRTT